MKHWFLAATAFALAAATSASAQSGLEGRVGKLESEMRAVQRKVFPGGSGALVAPEITPATPAPDRIGTPATSPVVELNQRVVALEQQVATITGQVEQAQYRLRQLEDQFTAYKKATDARLAAPAAGGGAGGLVAPAGAAEADVVVPTAPRPAAASASRPAAGASAKPAANDSARADRVAAVERPDTGDAAEDAYTYGYRLWAAKLYPEAEAQLKKMVADHPKHRRASFAQNLLGRAYLDDNKPSLASIAFYDNYKKYPEGERAPDSLFYLGTALTRLNKPADACKVYGELTDVYGATISAQMKADVAAARTAAKCK